MAEHLKLSETQKEILRGFSSYAEAKVTVGMLAMARKRPELLDQPGSDVLRAAVQMLDAGYFEEPAIGGRLWPKKSFNDTTLPKLTDLGERGREQLEKDDWR
jgi:hypothetical protein